MLNARKFQSLLNGGGQAAGAEALASEIASLKAEMDTYRRELGEMPAKRSQLILSDNANAEIDQLEGRERELYRLLEKAEIQVGALEPRLAEIRWREMAPKVARHRVLIGRATEALDAALVAAIAANEAARRASDDAAAELGVFAAQVPLVVFGGALTQACLDIWRNQLTDTRARLEKQQPPQPPRINKGQVARSLGS